MGKFSELLSEKSQKHLEKVQKNFRKLYGFFGNILVDILCDL